MEMATTGSRGSECGCMLNLNPCRKEFPAFLRNLFYFNKLWEAFDDIDTDDDRRIDFAEFQQGLGFVGMRLSASETKREFESLDDNDGGVVLFDEFCAWVAAKKCPVDGEVVDSFVMSTEVAHQEKGGAAGSGPRDADPDITNRMFDQLESQIVTTMNDKHKLKSLWRQLDFNGNGIVSLAEIDKFVVRF